MTIFFTSRKGKRNSVMKVKLLVTKILEIVSKFAGQKNIYLQLISVRRCVKLLASLVFSFHC